jgi:hypothetical protein
MNNKLKDWERIYVKRDATILAPKNMIMVFKLDDKNTIIKIEKHTRWFNLVICIGEEIYIFNKLRFAWLDTDVIFLSSKYYYNKNDCVFCLRKHYENKKDWYEMAVTNPNTFHKRVYSPDIKFIYNALRQALLDSQ